MSDKSYLGVTFKGVNGENMKAIFPDGTFSIVNNAGKLAMQTVGSAPDAAMAIESCIELPSLSIAVGWVQTSNSN